MLKFQVLSFPFEIYEVFLLGPGGTAGADAGSTGSSIDILFQAFQANFALTKCHCFLQVRANKGYRSARHRFWALSRSDMACETAIFSPF
jgi:hypothetical protein